ncbi:MULTISPECIES: hypothetical protein [unclassified Rhodanobacter]|nr:MULTISPECIES: hypothetical protein [unclassified Rhodanobacter]MBT2144394.1 hypothetical protein [Rhodanobacter sp. LX-99]MBT2149939.1 hypothetical protein [Rhodanobacter sp. LX-100]
MKMNPLARRHLHEFVPATPGCTIADLDHVAGYAAWAAGAARAAVTRRHR